MESTMQKLIILVLLTAAVLSSACSPKTMTESEVITSLQSSYDFCIEHDGRDALPGAFDHCIKREVMNSPIAVKKLVFHDDVVQRDFDLTSRVMELIAE